MLKKTFIVTALLTLCLTLSAQWRFEEERDTSRWAFHLSVGSTVATGFGKTEAWMWTAPRVTFRASDRLILHGGFASVGSLLDSYELKGYTPSFAPRRQGTRMLAGFASATYRVNDRLCLWASVQHVGGWFEPLWTPRGEAIDIDVTAFSGGFAYEFSDESLLEMHFHFVHDLHGNDALGLLGHPWYGTGVPSFELFSGRWLY